MFFLSESSTHVTHNYYPSTKVRVLGTTLLLGCFKNGCSTGASTRGFVTEAKLVGNDWSICSCNGGVLGRIGGCWVVGFCLKEEGIFSLLMEVFASREEMEVMVISVIS